jgi:hypothetical protein
MTKLCLFTQPKRCVDLFMENLWAHVAREDVHINFSFEIFDISKYIKNTFQNKGYIYHQQQKHHRHLPSLCTTICLYMYYCIVLYLHMRQKGYECCNSWTFW